MATLLMFGQPAMFAAQKRLLYVADGCGTKTRCFMLDPATKVVSFLVFAPVFVSSNSFSLFH